MDQFLQKHVFLFLIVIMSLLPADRGMVVPKRIDINVGIVMDLGSQTSKNLHDCITMAISDYYASRQHHKTRLILHTRDTSRASPAGFIPSALDLLEKTMVQALVIGPGPNVPETKTLGPLASKAKVPIFTFSSTLASPIEYPFLFHINQDQTPQFKAIGSILGLYKWNDVSLIFEDCEDGRESIPYLVRSLQERGVRVTHRTPIHPVSPDDQILDELHKLAISQQTVFIVHLSPSSAYRLFLMAKKLGMMEEGYAWIVTDKTMNRLQSIDEKMYQAMQGMVGLKSYIPSSRKLQEFRLRWKKEFYSNNSSEESSWDVDVQCILAYDTMWALAEAVENLGHKSYTNTDEMAGENLFSGEELVYGIARTRFTGLSGEFQMVGGKIQSKVLEVVNVIEIGERSIGLWSLEHGIVKGRSLSVSGSTPKHDMGGLTKAVIWPGFTTVAPKGRPMLTAGKKLRIAVLDSGGFGLYSSVKLNIDANTTSITGYCIDVFLAARKLLNYQLDFEFIPYVDQYGINLDSYTDLVYQVYLENYDGIVGDISITGNRSLYVDFTVTYSDAGLGTIMKRDNNDIWLFYKPFHPKLWLILAAFLVLTGFVVWAIERSSENTEFEGPIVHQIGTALWFGCSTLFYAHSEKLKSNWSRLVVIVWLFSVFILTSSYTATLSSMLTFKQIKLGSVGEYVGTHYNSFITGTIADNPNYKDNRLLTYKSPEEYADALSKGKKGGVGAIIDEIPYLKVFLEKYGTDYAMVASQYTTNGFGFAFQKKYSSLVSDLSLAIIRLREEGTLAAMEDFWLKSSRNSLLPEADFTAPSNLGLQTFGGLFLVSILCCCSALLFHFGLKILQKKMENFSYIMFILAHMLNKMAPKATGTDSPYASNSLQIQIGTV